MDQTLDSTPDSTQEPLSWLQLLKRIVKPLLILIVVLGIGQSVRLAWRDLNATQARASMRIEELRQRLDHARAEERPTLESEIASIEQSRFSLHRIRWDFVLGSIGCSFIALFPPAFFWWLTLRAFDHSVPLIPTLAIHSAGTLGKYVPGKAMVLIVRSGALKRYHVPISTSIVSIFVETLSSLAVGGALGAFTLTGLKPPPWLWMMSLGAAVCSLLPTIPAIFQSILIVLSRSRHLRLPDHLASAMSWKLVVRGWFLFLAAWLLMGTSLWVICEAIRWSMDAQFHAGTGPVSTMRLWWICIAASCLGFVIGFLSMLPGGAGVREVVVTMLLAPAIGYAPALAAAVLYRVSNLVAELMMAGAAWLIVKRSDFQTRRAFQ